MAAAGSDQQNEDAQIKNHFNLVSGSTTLNMIVVGFVMWAMGFSLHTSELLPLESILCIGSLFTLFYAPFSFWELSQTLCERSLEENNKDSKIFMMSIQSTSREPKKTQGTNSTWSSLTPQERNQFG